MMRIKTECVMGQPTIECDECSVMLADIFISDNMGNEVVDKTVVLALCRECVTMFRRELKETFKQMEMIYAEEKRNGI